MADFPSRESMLPVSFIARGVDALRIVVAGSHCLMTIPPESSSDNTDSQSFVVIKLEYLQEFETKFEQSLGFK
jgi:hypothetical protein